MNNLPFLLRPGNIVRYEDGDILILDRRRYPLVKTFVRCQSCEEVARAIEEMVTQSAGPSLCAGYGMVQSAHQSRALRPEGLLQNLAAAARRLTNTRPTNNSIRLMVNKLLAAGKEAVDQGRDVELVLLESMEREVEWRYRRSTRLGEVGASLLHDGDCVLNHCWAESGIVYTLLAAQQQGKRVSAYCTETRPYLQGARLTSDAIAEMGIPTTIVCDDAPAYLMSKGKISAFFTGADRVTLDGSVINKIGTFQIALAAHHFNIPFYAFCFGPDPSAPTPDAVVIEERDPQEVLFCLGQRTATPRANGYNPAFDVTPPSHISALITDRGTFAPHAIGEYLATDKLPRPS